MSAPVRTSQQLAAEFRSSQAQQQKAQAQQQAAKEEQVRKASNESQQQAASDKRRASVVAQEEIARKAREQVRTWLSSIILSAAALIVFSRCDCYEFSNCCFNSFVKLLVLNKKKSAAKPLLRIQKFSAETRISQL